MDEEYRGYLPDSPEDAEQYGTPRHSGRYPWGSGKNPQRNKIFIQRANELKKQGLTDKQIAEAFEMSTGQYRAAKSIAVNAEKKDMIRRVQALKDKGYSNVAIGKRLGIPESTVRNYLNPAFELRRDRASLLADELKKQVAERKYLDVGDGVNLQLNVSQEQMKTAIEILKSEGYQYHRLSIPQASDPTHKTSVVVLTDSSTDYNEVVSNRDKISSPQGIKFEDYGELVRKFERPKSINSDRVLIRYGDDGGSEKDGVIELREGVSDLNIGASRYAQVRIAVDDTHYLKGMALYGDPKEFPPGVDIIFNTNKDSSTPKMKVLKSMKTDKDGNIDLENPFGASIKDQRGALNIVNEDEDWQKWSKNLSSQFLSKQYPQLAIKQLNQTYSEKKKEYDDICSLTNPTIKRKLLESFADDCDSAAVHLKAAALPRQAAHVILPVGSLKDNEIYAPNYNNGEEVVLIRYPHGGVFEIPRLRVNNNNEEAKRVLGNAKTAVGINSHVAQQLSGADFDGDTVTVIPTKGQNIKTGPKTDLALFNPSEKYPAFDGMPETGPKTGFHKQQEMGKVSNLITDMQIKGAPFEDVACAVRHSMVVIDAEKHNLDWRASETDNRIKQLKAEYQGGANKGASTIISRASSDDYVNERKEFRNFKKMTPEEQEKYLEGKIIFRETGRMKRDSKTGKLVPAKEKTTKMATTDDARTLVSKEHFVIEEVYASHANRLKALANEARKELRFNTGKLQMNASAKEAYAEERASLISKLNIAKKNAPLERQAQLIASVKSAARIKANPELDRDDRKKIRAQEIERARKIVGTRPRNPQRPDNISILITDREWNAIQAGAISDSMLMDILKNTDLDRLREKATPRKTKRGISAAALSRARGLLGKGYTYAEVASELGVSVSTLNKELNG